MKGSTGNDEKNGERLNKRGKPKKMFKSKKKKDWLSDGKKESVTSESYSQDGIKMKS